MRRQDCQERSILYFKVVGREKSCQPFCQEIEAFSPEAIDYS